MLQNYEELENAFSHKSENEKNRFLSDMLVAALATPNPVKSLYDAISYQRSLRAKIKFVNCISKSTKVSPIMAQASLENLIKNNHFINKRKQI